MSQKKLGLALGSGGVRGFAHLGVIKALEEAEIKIDFLSGSSAGAIVGAFYAATKDVDTIITKFTKHKKEIIKALFDPSLKGGFVKGDKFEKLFNEWFGVEEFSSLQIPLTIVTTDLISGEPVLFSEGQLAPAVLASMSVPNIFTPNHYEDKLLADGGLCLPVPDGVVRQMGAEVVLAVNLDNHNLKADPEASYDSFKNVSLRSFNILRHYLAKHSLTSSDLIIEPPLAIQSIVGLEKYLLKDSGEIESIIKAGYDVTKHALPEIKKLLS